jgi:hypothetical protein
METTPGPPEHEK